MSLLLVVVMVKLFVLGTRDGCVSLQGTSGNGQREMSGAGAATWHRRCLLWRVRCGVVGICCWRLSFGWVVLVRWYVRRFAGRGVVCVLWRLAMWWRWRCLLLVWAMVCAPSRARCAVCGDGTVVGVLCRVVRDVGAWGGREIVACGASMALTWHHGQIVRPWF